MSAQTEHDVVLSAIRRGEASLPAIKRATGIDYPKLQTVLYELESEWRSIKRGETVDGFDRYTPAASEKTSPKGDKIVTPSVPPSATKRTFASLDATALTIEQRSAPLCVKCRAVTVIHGVDRDGRRRWKCGPCKTTFLGTSANGGHAVTRSDPHAEARERLAEITAHGQRPQPAIVSEKPDAETLDEAEDASSTCDCGRLRHSKHCAYRRKQKEERKARLAEPDEHAKEKEAVDVVFNPSPRVNIAQAVSDHPPTTSQMTAQSAPVLTPLPVFEGGCVSFEAHFSATIEQMLDWNPSDFGQFWDAVRLLRKMGAQIKEVSESNQ